MKKTTPLTDNCSILSRYALSRKDIKNWLNKANLSTAHTRSLMGSIYSESRVSPPQTIKVLFERHFTKENIQLHKAITSHVDKSVKLLLRLYDDSLVESVILQEKHRISLCVSSQVGCALKCRFCATGKMGLKRNLSCAEIIQQWLMAQRWLQHNHISMPISNIVFMGMGEPCHNLKGVVQAIEIFLDPWAIGIAPKRITISTAGYLVGLKKLFKIFPQISYAISLHATDQTSRANLMPISKKFPLTQLLSYLRETSQNYDKTFFIQYTLISGVNDDTQSAIKLSQLLKGIRCKINLLLLNPIQGESFHTPKKNTVFLFGKHLKDYGYQVSIRFSKGKDIAAACGQLITEESPSTA